MLKTKFVLLHCGLILLAIFIILYLFPVVHQFGGMYLPVSKDEIEEHAAASVEALDIDIDELRKTTYLRINRDVYSHILHEYGLKNGNILLRENVPAFYWDIRWVKAELSDNVDNGSDNEIVAPLSRLQSTVRLHVDGNGNLNRFQIDIGDTVSITGVDADSARSLAEIFLRDFTQHKPETLLFQSHRERILDNRTDHIFSWEDTSAYQPLSSTIEVTIAGSTVSTFNVLFDVPGSGVPSTQEVLSILSSAIPYIIISIMMIVIGINRMRHQEIGFKNGLFLGIIAGLIVGVNLFLQEFIGQMGWMVLIPLIFGPLTIGIYVIFVVTVSEAVGRQSWKEKFIPYDLVSNGHILHSSAGKSYIRGIALGITAFALSLIAIRAMDLIHPITYNWSQSNPLDNYSPPFPAMRMLLNDFWTKLVHFSVLVLFLVSYFRQRVSNRAILIIIPALIFGLTDWNITFPAISGILICTLYAAFFIWILYRFDVVSAFLALLTFSLAGTAATLLLSGNDFYTGEGILLTVIIGILFIIGIVSQYTPDRVTNYEEIAPVYQKYISERERLQRELEIAHEVQMSFLPKEKPDIRDIDVAGRCIPAHEVGGDYYDFIIINDNQFGVVIGDVSGKGTKASFYMTLTKGILRSTARHATNPARVLTDVNRTFYESAERGAFISMVYGIFNMNENTLTVARAGHNPVIFWKSAAANGELINPEGIALGLNRGSIFNNTIKEVTIRYESGDVFIFYTDGFSEAVNKQNEEFSDKRLNETAQKYNHLSAEEILNAIVSETNQFTGRTPQRDDMTMVVVKIR
jgi:phosphoserine phosphatase RsbU/P